MTYHAQRNSIKSWWGLCGSWIDLCHDILRNDVRRDTRKNLCTEATRPQSSFHGKSPWLTRGRNRLRLRLSACIQAGRYSKVEHFGIDVSDAAIGIKSVPQKMKEMCSKTLPGIIYFLLNIRVCTRTRKILARAVFFSKVSLGQQCKSNHMEQRFQTSVANYMLVAGHENCCRFATLQGVHQRMRIRVEHFQIDPKSGVTAEWRNTQQEKTEVEVFPIVNLCAQSAFCFFFVGDVTQVKSTCVSLPTKPKSGTRTD